MSPDESLGSVPAHERVIGPSFQGFPVWFSTRKDIRIATSPMTQEDIFEIFAQVHENPALWLSNLYPFENRQLSAFASGCEILLLNGFTAAQIRSTVEQNPRVLDSLIDGQYDKALRVANALASGRIYSQMESFEAEEECAQIA